MKTLRKIELLAPARNADIGIEAINCGADAVYIGAPAYGARSAATNSLDDIERLVNYAHIFGAKVYVTLNTILYDNELADAKTLALSLTSIGVDALIVQDFAYLKMGLEIPLHASTQMDNRSAEKVRLLSKLGFEQVVLARELGLKDFSEIHKICPDVVLEAFVHGALCVSYSGKCYASQYCFGRSANRGECAQFCRLAFDLEDGKGNVLLNGKHLLSLKDMNRSKYIEDMIDSGVSSFKIEGRLKDLAYVKNITTWYRQTIDNVIAKRPDELQRSSAGVSSLSFVPNVQKTFNRGYTDYFLERRDGKMSSMNSPKSIGEPMGKVCDVAGNFVTVNGKEKFHNGDGLCYFNEKQVLGGCRVNKVENDRLYLVPFPKDLKKNTPVYRNYDVKFEAELNKKSCARYLLVNVSMRAIDGGFVLDAHIDDIAEARLIVECDKQLARTPQSGRIQQELKKSSYSFFKIECVDLEFKEDFFIPSSLLSGWRRELHELLLKNVLDSNSPTRVVATGFGSIGYEDSCLGESDFSLNVGNQLAKDFYEHDMGMVVGEPALECMDSVKDKGSITLMTCKYCLRYALGQCLKNRQGQSKPYAHIPRLPNRLQLSLPDGRKFSLHFNCSKCEMTITGK